MLRIQNGFEGYYSCANKKELPDAMKDHILAGGELVGIFSRAALETV